MNNEHDYEQEPYPTNPDDDRILLALIVLGVVALYLFTGV